MMSTGVENERGLAVFVVGADAVDGGIAVEQKGGGAEIVEEVGGDENVVLAMREAGKAHVENDNLLVAVRAEESAQRPGEMISDGAVLRVDLQLDGFVLEMEEGAERNLRSDATADDAE